MRPLPCAKMCLAVIVLFLSACTPAPNAHPHDPYEPFNRKVFAFNQTVNDFIGRPVAGIYASLVPNVVQNGIDNAFQNLEQPFYAMNHGLQGHWGQAGLSLWRFIINSTIGMLGLLDVATESGLPADPQNFAQTLAFYGCQNKTYFVLPLLGPKMTCEVWSLPADYYVFDFWPYVHNQETNVADTLWLARLIDRQSRLLDLYRMMDASFDPYVFIRHGYMAQHGIQPIETVTYDLDDDAT